MEEGLAYKAECCYDYFCVRASDTRIMFITEGKLYDQLKIRENYSLYNFINKNVRINDELVATGKLCYIF